MAITTSALSAVVLLDASLNPNSIFLVTMYSIRELILSVLMRGSWYTVSWNGCATAVESNGIVNCKGPVTVTGHYETMAYSITVDTLTI